MPCYTPPPTIEQMNESGRLASTQLEAVLCGIISHHGQNILIGLDYEEIGVPDETVNRWWVRHKKEDDARRAREEAQRKKQEVINTLTPEQKEALGL